MRAASWGVVVIAMAVTLVLLSSLLLVEGPGLVPAGSGENGTGSAGGSGGGSAENHGGSSSGAASASILPANPANCSQGNRTLVVNPGPGDMHNTLIQDYDTLGEDGGGTLLLRPGIFYLNETLQFRSHGNVSIQGAGMGKTILSVPPSPVGSLPIDWNTTS